MKVYKLFNKAIVENILIEMVAKYGKPCPGQTIVYK